MTPAAGFARTLVVALTVIAALVGLSFGLQAGGLAREPPASHLVVEAVAKLELYHRSQASMVIDGRRLTAVCTDRWRRRRRVSTVTLSDGRTIREVRDKLLTHGRLAEGEFELAACPRALTVLLAQRLRDGAEMRVVSTRFEGRRAYRVSFPAEKVKVSLVLPRAGGLPLAIGFVGRSVKGFSRVKFGAGGA